jgi:probable HAF family extracellular repeat protein
MRGCPVILVSCIALAGCDSLSPDAAIPGTPPRPSFQLSSSIASGYVAVDLGSLGTPYSEALAINNVGQVVAVGLPGRELSVFLWAHGEQTVLGEMGDCIDHHDLINDAGEVVCAGSRWASGVTTALGIWAEAINEPGQVTGTAPNGHAALWDHGVITDLGTLGGSFSRPFALNDAGQVVGWSATATGQYHAFVWADGVMTDIGTLGGTLSQAVAVNAAGQVVGASRTATAGQEHAFLWQNGVLSDLGTLGGQSSGARAINDAGQVVGSSTTAAGQSHAFRWANGVMSDLGTLGGAESEALALNEAGQIVGLSTIPSGESHAFLWANEVMTDLGTLGGNWSQPAAINAAGQVVGRSVTRFVTYPENFDFRAVLWRPMTTAEWIEALTGQVNDLLAAGTLTQDQADGLLNKLQQVRAKLDAAQNEAAGHQMEAFAHQVEGFVAAGVLTSEQARPLIDAARGIIDRLQSPSS